MGLYGWLMLKSVGSMPFDVYNKVQHAKESIEVELTRQRVEKRHRANHAHLEELHKQQLEFSKTYDKFGNNIVSKQPQKANVDIKV